GRLPPVDLDSARSTAGHNPNGGCRTRTPLASMPLKLAYFDHGLPPVHDLGTWPAIYAGHVPRSWKTGDGRCAPTTFVIVSPRQRSERWMALRVRVSISRSRPSGGCLIGM